MSQKKSFAEVEFDILAKVEPGSGILAIRGEVIELLSAFSESGQSGGSAPYTAYAISSEIKRGLENDVLIEMSQNTDSLAFDFVQSINRVCEKIKSFGLESQVEDIVDKIRKLCLFDPIAPITGADEEWGDVMDYGDGKSWYQNRRCSALFKDGIDGKPYYIDAIIKRDQNGVCWSGMAWLSEEDYKSGDRDRMVGKRGYVKSFPFVPKTFYFDVRDIEIAKDDWESFVVNPAQLTEAWEYYDRK